jgi:hypothetical protein
VVNVISQQVVGPYDTVQLQSTDPNALNAWLGANGYTIPPDVQPVIAAYVNEGFDFLAMRLAPGQGVQAMRPISVTSSGAALSLPLRMVAAGTGATVGITLWVVSSGRYEPQNFPKFTVSPSEIVWDWSTSKSNYSTLQMQKEAALNDTAWQIESSLDIGPYQVENLVLGDTAATDYTDIPSTDAGPGETAAQVRQMDLATLFPLGGSSVRITRMRGDLSHAALANDLVLQASSDQTALSNVYQVTQSVNAPPCPSAANCPCGNSIGGGLGQPDAGAIGDSDSGLGGFGAGGGGGATTSSAAPKGQESFGCVTSAGQPTGGGLALALGGLVGAALVGARTRRKR